MLAITIKELNLQNSGYINLRKVNRSFSIWNNSVLILN